MLLLFICGNEILLFLSAAKKRKYLWGESVCVKCMQGCILKEGPPQLPDTPILQDTLAPIQSQHGTIAVTELHRMFVPIVSGHC